MKKSATAEQKARAEARRERFKALCKQVASMSDVERAELTERVGAVLTCEGRALSLRNTLLCMMQRPDCSIVGGFRQWIKGGRCVVKGESGMSILIPAGRGVTTSAAHEETAADGGRLFFISGTVFDVSQTRALEAGEGAEAGEGTEAPEDAPAGLCVPPGAVPVLEVVPVAAAEVVRPAGDLFAWGERWQHVSPQFRGKPFVVPTFGLSGPGVDQVHFSPQ